MKNSIKKTNGFDSVSVKLASPEDILSWSFGEVTKAETINYRTQKPERGGLFDEKIFGPQNDFQCSCGKYKGAQYHGITCENCGVEITRSIVRRERMGHIELVTPVAHIWYLRKIPSKISLILNVSSNALTKVVYFSSYIITSVDNAKKKELESKIKVEFQKQLKSVTNNSTRKKLNELYRGRISDLQSVNEGEIIGSEAYYVLSNQFPKLFEAGTGSEPVLELLKKINLKKLEKEIEKKIESSSEIQSEKLYKQLSLVRSLIKSGVRPEHMFLTRIPVIPPDLRPLVPLEGGRHASSDLNDLYRKVINRNDRLRQLYERKAPAVIVQNEKRILQEAVDALMDGSVKYNNSNTIGRGQNRQLKSLSETLNGKEGIFRTNLLGKRVDYSGRSVIVIGPHLKLNQCGLPKEMAIELFRPFVVSELLNRELAYNIRGANRLIDDREEPVWAILEGIIKDRYVLLNRQPSLHRQSVQAFQPILIEGSAIELHPLVCTAYNADFDGDQMPVYIPLTEESQIEAREILSSTKNIVNPGTGEINASPSKHDIALGCYWATKMKVKKDGSKKVYFSPNEAISAWEYDVIDLDTQILVFPSAKERYSRFNGKYFETTVGRILFNKTLQVDFPFINESVSTHTIREITDELVNKYGIDDSIEYFDKIKSFGFEFATKSGITYAWSDLKIPKEKEEKVNEGIKKQEEINKQYNDGLISFRERKAKNIELWQSLNMEFTDLSGKSMGEGNPIAEIIYSGARGSFNDLTSSVGIIGIVDTASGNKQEQPITSSIKDGLSPIEYFNFSFGARKGLTDTALKTARAGYLSRQLFDLSQEVTVEGEDCGTSRGFTIYRNTISGVGTKFSTRIKGRFVSEDINGKDGLILKKNGYIDLETSIKIDSDDSIQHIKVRSPITCRYPRGVCKKCYGDDKSTNQIVDLGEPVGVNAALSIGEPGTQLTMRTFHAGGVAAIGGDITNGLERVTELFGKRSPKGAAVISKTSGVVESIEKRDDGNYILMIKSTDKKATIKDEEHFINQRRYINISKGDNVEKGQLLTDGSADLDELLHYAGKEKTQEYIFEEINRIYEVQAVHLSPVHFELIIRQMFSRYVVVDPGDSLITKGDVIELIELNNINKDLEEKGKRVIKAENIVEGTIKVSTSRSNFLSAASFQSTSNILINAAIKGAKDALDELKGNVIIGRLVPVGTAYLGSSKNAIVESALAQKNLETKKREKERKLIEKKLIEK